MNTFTLATGRKVEKDAKYCVAVKCNGKWNHKWFKSYRGADNEMSWLRNSRSDTKAYYGIEEYRMIKPED